MVGQPVHAHASSETPALQHDGFVQERSQIHLAGNHVGVDREYAAAGLFEPEVNAYEIAGGYGSPCQHPPGDRLFNFPFRIEEVHRGMADNGIVRDRQLSSPECFAATTPIFSPLPKDPHATPDTG